MNSYMKQSELQSSRTKQTPPPPAPYEPSYRHYLSQKPNLSHSLTHSITISRSTLSNKNKTSPITKTMTMFVRSRSPLRWLHVLLCASLLLLLTTMMMQQQQQQVAAQQVPPPFCDTLCWCDSDGGLCPVIDNRRLPTSFGSVFDDVTPSEAYKIARLVPDASTLVDFLGDEDCQPYPDVAAAMGVQECNAPPKAKNDERFVCLFVYDEEECDARGVGTGYSLKTVPSTARIAGRADRSVVTHTGSCGVFKCPRLGC